MLLKPLLQLAKKYTNGLDKGPHMLRIHSLTYWINGIQPCSSDLFSVHQFFLSENVMLQGTLWNVYWFSSTCTEVPLRTIGTSS